jgi:hypothetical protein
MKQLQIFGDSEILIDCPNNKFTIDNILLATIMNQVLNVKQHFNEIYFPHTHTHTYLPLRRDFI